MDREPAVYTTDHEFFPCRDDCVDVSSEWILMRGRRLSSVSHDVDASGAPTSAAVGCLAAGRGHDRLPIRTAFTRRVFGWRGAACMRRRRLDGSGVKRVSFPISSGRFQFSPRNYVIDRLNEIIVVPAPRTIREDW